MAAVDAEIGLASLGEAPPLPRELSVFEDLLELASFKRDAMLKVHLEEHVSLVRFDPAHGMIEVHLLPGAPKELGNHLRERLQQWTGRRWMVGLSPRLGEKPYGQLARERAAAELEALKKHPAVEAVFEVFPDAKIVAVKPATKRKKRDRRGGG